MLRILAPVSDPAPAELELTGAQHHYLAHVLRLEVGSTLELFDGVSRAFDARILQLETDRLVLSLGPARVQSARRKISVLQGLPKGDKLEWVLQKGTELGAGAFYPVATQRSVVKLEARKAQERTQRWQKIVEEAARQCRRSDVPEVHPPGALLDAAEALAPGTALLVLDEEEDALPLGEAFLRVEKAGPVALVVGPEGGLAREEVQALKQLGAQAVSMGSLILRTETAALAALSVMAFLDGELGRRH